MKKQEAYFVKTVRRAVHDHENQEKSTNVFETKKSLLKYGKISAFQRDLGQKTNICQSQESKKWEMSSQ